MEKKGSLSRPLAALNLTLNNRMITSLKKLIPNNINNTYNIYRYCKQTKMCKVYVMCVSLLGFF